MYVRACVRACVGGGRVCQTRSWCSNTSVSVGTMACLCEWWEGVDVSATQ